MVMFLISWLLLYLIFAFGLFLIGAAFRLIFEGLADDDMWKVIGGAVLGIVTVVGLKHIAEKDAERRKQLHAGGASSTTLQRRS